MENKDYKEILKDYLDFQYTMLDEFIKESQQLESDTEAYKQIHEKLTFLATLLQRVRNVSCELLPQDIKFIQTVFYIAEMYKNRTKNY